MESRLKKGELIELSNERDLINLWFSERTQNFCLMLNAKVIKSTKTWNPIKTKLKEFRDLTES